MLLIAKRRAALRELHAAFREREVTKRYLALVCGRWELGSKRIELPLLTNQKQGGERMVRVHESGKDARSTFEGADFFGARATLMTVGIDTGRTHQIRVHLQHLGHPIAGDPLYGRRDQFARHLLHAWKLEFTHPRTGEILRCVAPLPADFGLVPLPLKKAASRP